VTAVDPANQLVGSDARATLEYVVKAIVDDPEAVQVEVDEGRSGEVVFRLHVGPTDMGRVIGKRGRVAQAIRQVVRAAATRDGVRVVVDIVD
jgi:predicted RNA-binding protein YlqC (UPF0109 family)